MNFINNLSKSMVVLVLILVAAHGEALAQRPKLVGKISVKTQDATRPLSGAAVLLCRGDQVVKRTYTDAKGTYVFYKVPNGGYTARVQLGNQKLNILDGEGHKKKELPVEVTDRPTRKDLTVVLE